MPIRTASPEAAVAAKAPPLCVDLDGTLIRTDLLWESIVFLLRRRPWSLLAIPFWLLQGRAYLKQELARRASIDVVSLPYNPELMSWLRNQRSGGREILLVTAADERLANQVAAHTGLFDRVLASNGKRNLRGQRKLEAIRREVPGRFEYAADCGSDLPIWRYCASAIVVGARSPFVEAVRKDVPNLKTLDCADPMPLRPFGAALRIRQWSKNVLIFVPLVTSHRLFDPVLLLKEAVTFFLFSLCASAQYVLNDLVDLENDRRHRLKRRRPFASGDLPLPAGFILAPTLLTISLGIAFLLSPWLAATLVGYFVVSLWYSLSLKKKIVADAFVLAGLYTFRIVVGHLVTGIAFSVWLLAFSFALFLSLAFSKRAAELLRMRQSGATDSGRGYRTEDFQQVNLFGVCSAFLSGAIFLLYLQSETARALYRAPELLWLLSPVYLYWTMRLWLRASRGEVDEDPVVFVLKDSVTYATAAICGLIMLLATRSLQGLF